MVSQVSTTVNGITTTTITYSDGTTEVETSAASAQAGQGNQSGSQPGQTYNSQGALSGASAAASGV